MKASLVSNPRGLHGTKGERPLESMPHLKGATRTKQADDRLKRGTSRLSPCGDSPNLSRAGLWGEMSSGRNLMIVETHWSPTTTEEGSHDSTIQVSLPLPYRNIS